MRDVRTRPGEAAQRAFDTGIRAAALGGLALLAGLYLTGLLGPLAAAVGVVLLFPTYLLVVAALLSRWLGLGKDHTDLRPVRTRRSRTVWER